MSAGYPLLICILIILALTLALLVTQFRMRAWDRQDAARDLPTLRDSLEFLTELVENNGAIIYAKDLHGRYQLVNRKWEEVTGKPRQEVLGHTSEEVFQPGNGMVSGLHESEVVANGAPVEEEEIVRTPAGDRHFLSVKFPLRNKDRTVRGMCGMSTDITRAKRDLRKFQDLASRLEVERNYAQASALADGLTGLANRRAFDEVMNTEFYRLKRSGGSLALVMLDVDRFKRFNDRYGHLAGDDCLRRIAQALRGGLQRVADFGARYGGEEFAVVLPDTDLDGAALMAERIRSLVEELAIPHLDNPPNGVVTISLGVAARNPLLLDAWDRLVELADTALYRAKHAGRNRVEPCPVDSTAGQENANLIRLVWRKSAESGHVLIDGQHRALFDQSNRLLSALVEGHPPEVCAEHWQRLLEEVQTHFRDEEALLVQVGYPEAVQHARIHADLEQRAADMQEGFLQGRTRLGELFSFLAYEVVAQHMFREDCKFFPYVAGR